MTDIVIALVIASPVILGLCVFYWIDKKQTQREMQHPDYMLCRTIATATDCNAMVWEKTTSGGYVCKHNGHQYAFSSWWGEGVDQGCFVDVRYIRAKCDGHELLYGANVVDDAIHRQQHRSKQDTIVSASTDLVEGMSLCP